MYTWYYLPWSQCGRTWFSGCASQRYLTSLRKVLQTKLEILLSRIYWDSVRSRQDITSRMVKWKKYLWSTNRSFHIECMVRRNMVTKQSVKLAAEFFSARKVHMKREITQPSTDYLVCQLRSQLSRHTKQFRLKTDDSTKSSGIYPGPINDDICNGWLGGIWKHLDSNEHKRTVSVKSWLFL